MAQIECMRQLVLQCEEGNPVLEEHVQNLKYTMQAINEFKGSLGKIRKNIIIYAIRLQGKVLLKRLQLSQEEEPSQMLQHINKSSS